MRIPFIDPLPVIRIVPPSATNLANAVAAAVYFLTDSSIKSKSTVLLTGAGISVAVGSSFSYPFCVLYMIGLVHILLKQVFNDTFSLA
jgi:hypothetical protein